MLPQGRVGTAYVSPPSQLYAQSYYESLAFDFDHDADHFLWLLPTMLRLANLLLAKSFLMLVSLSIFYIHFRVRPEMTLVKQYERDWESCKVLDRMNLIV